MGGGGEGGGEGGGGLDAPLATESIANIAVSWTSIEGRVDVQPCRRKGAPVRYFLQQTDVTQEDNKVLVECNVVMFP